MTRFLVQAALLPTLLLALAAAAEQAMENAGDDRQAYSDTSPSWLRAVGVLSVPGIRYRDGRRSHHQEDCSATLLAPHSGQQANIIVTAWHCLENYRDLSRSILFTLPQASSGGITREARRLADGGGIHADWAILRLSEPVSTEYIRALSVRPEGVDPQRHITTAGYSRDAGLGMSGERLTYDANCDITHRQSTLIGSDCRAHKGASGGAVVQLSDDGEAQLSGVISQGDGAGVLLFVPIDGFSAALDRYL